MPPEERLGAFTRHYGITLEAQANNYVTYFYRQHEYQGGIHGFTTEVGFTFRKSDGKQIALLADTDSPELAQLIKKGVKKNFANGSEEEMSDEELLDYLFAGIIFLPNKQKISITYHYLVMPPISLRQV